MNKLLRQAFHKLLVTCVFFFACRSLFGQVGVPTIAPASPADRSFDVVSIRRSATEEYSRWHTGRDGYSARNVTLQQIIFYAYSSTDEKDSFDNIISFSQLRDLPKWAESEQYDVTAKVDQRTVTELSGLSLPELSKIYQKMLRQVLAERCKLQVKHEKVAQSVYLLETSREGSKLIPSNVPFDKSSLSTGRGQIAAEGYQVGDLASELIEPTGRLVVDFTQLHGTYDYKLKWRPDSDTDTANTNPSIFAAVKEQLGLVLVPAKSAVDSIAVTHLERPTAN